MFAGVFALLERSLRVDARTWSSHLTRIALVGAIYFSLCWTQFEDRNVGGFGAPGLRFFSTIAWLDALFMTMMGISFFSSSITEEKEEDTLGLMMMAGISPLGVLVGKTGGRLVQALLLLAVQYPFLQLSVTMGGILGVQVWDTMVGLLAYLVLLAGLGLFCSILSPNSRSAGTMMILGIICYIAIPIVARSLVFMHNSPSPDWTDDLKLSPVWWELIEGIGNLCIFLRLNDILATGFLGSALSLQVISDIIAGVLFALLAWACFGVALRNPSTEASTRGVLAVRRGQFRFTAGRVWNNPFAWKDYYFVSGGAANLYLRSGFYIGLLIFWIFAGPLLFGMGQGENWANASLICIMLFLPVDMAMLVSRSMYEEVRGQTLSALLMLPRNAHQVIYSKLAGAVIGWIPGPVMGIALLLITDDGHAALSNFWNPHSFWIIPLVALILSMVPHYAAIFALYMRWGAVPLAIVMTYFTVMVFEVFGLIFYWLFFGATMNNSIVPLVIALAYFALIGWLASCHLHLLFRIQVLGAK